MDNKKATRRITAIVLFVVALGFTELSPFSRNAVALTNGGYDRELYHAESDLLLSKHK